MKLRTWPILAVAFGSLIALIAILGGSTMRQAGEVYGEISTLHDDYRRRERILNEVRSEIHLSGVLVRDYLLDPSHITGGLYKEQLLAIRSSMTRELDDLRNLIAPEDLPKLERWHKELDKYWDSLDPLFEWTPRQQMALSHLFLRRVVLPHRTAVLDVAQEFQELNRLNLQRQQEKIDQMQRQVPKYVTRMLAMTIALGLAVAGISIFRITRLEGRSEREKRRAETAESELRRLSQQLVQAQEEERKSISRELHDQVGQLLTALRMELSNLGQLRDGAKEEFEVMLKDTKHLSEQALRTVRDLAMGLRPSMLDDLGLGAALQWQAREFGRRCGVPVSVDIEGVIEGLPENHRTCVFRVLQEALTNCARHSKAKDIRITLHGHNDWLFMTIQDNGIGFDTSRTKPRGLGLIGIEERVRELGGAVHIYSQEQKGVLLSVRIPVERGAAVA
ncbi:MAG: sensor histidine kinase [Bryobacteraceae bacterium]